MSWSEPVLLESEDDAPMPTRDPVARRRPGPDPGPGGSTSACEPSGGRRWLEPGAIPWREAIEVRVASGRIAARLHPETAYVFA